MAFPLLSLLPTILKTVGKVVGLNVFNDAADALTKAQLTPEQELALQDSLQRHEAAMKQLSADELKTAVNESLAMVSSTDSYTARARPTMLYVATGITATLAIIVGITLLRHVPIELGSVGAIVSLMTPLWGAGGYYIYARTQEKLANNGANG